MTDFLRSPSPRASGPLKLAIAQISCESNHFVSGLGEVDHFRKTGYLLEGKEVRQLEGTETEIGGAFDVLATEPSVTVEPLVAARGTLSGPLSSTEYREVRTNLMERLQAACPIDGLLLSLHGSMCAEDTDDTEGDILSRVRECVGLAVPIAVTLDLHANVTERMVEAATIFVAYRRYPHDDARETGRRATALVCRAMRREINPIMTYAKLPMLLTAFNASTDPGSPFGELVRLGARFEEGETALAVSMFFVGSYIDVREIGCGVSVVTHANPATAEDLTTSLALEFWDTRSAFQVQTLSVAEAIRRGRLIQGGPVLLLDTADTVGGGAAGDSSLLIRALIECKVNEPSLAMVVDPPAAARCIHAGVGATVTVELGHKLDPRWGTPFPVTGVVQRITDGAFRYGGGILGGTNASAGPSAVLEVGVIRILVMSRATYDWGREQYESAGLDVRTMKFIGVKNMMNFRIGYRDVMKDCFVLDLPGPTPPDMRMLPFRRIPRDTYPFDEERRTPMVELSRSLPLARPR